MERKRSAASSALAWMCPVLPALSVFVLMFAVPYALLWTLFWVASGSWDFDGTHSLKRWLLVKGSRLDQLGFVAPAAAPARYGVSFQEGTFPGWRVAMYDSTASPADIIAAYAGRCTLMGLRVTKREPVSRTARGDEEAFLECEIEPYLDVQVFAERKVSTTLTDVSMRVWGSD
jgi:hypothetical protein